jgi:hypothetical protein
MMAKQKRTGVSPNEKIQIILKIKMLIPCKNKISIENMPAMKFFLLLLLISCCGICLRAQNPEILNNYKYVFIPQLTYSNGKTDIYDLRKTTIEKLTSSGIPLYLNESEIPDQGMQNPCSIVHCLMGNTTSVGSKLSEIIIIFINCKNDTLLNYSASAKSFPTLNETRNGFVKATKQALEPFNSYHYKFTGADEEQVIKTESGDDSIAWNPQRKLVWADFKGQPQAGEPADALTYTANQTSFEGFSVGSRFNVKAEITCYFIKANSWVKEGKATEYLLNHEQRHFDIAEASAREFRKEIQLAHFNSNNMNELSQKISEEVHQKYGRLQQQYDSETNHSRIEEKQKEWNVKIDKMLRDLEEYK